MILYISGYSFLGVELRRASSRSIIELVPDLVVVQESVQHTVYLSTHTSLFSIVWERFSFSTFAGRLYQKIIMNLITTYLSDAFDDFPHLDSMKSLSWID